MTEEIERLRKKTFVFFETYDDEVYFKMKIRQWIEDGQPTSLFRLVWEMVVDRNKLSLKNKYLKEKKGKLYIDRDLVKWVKLIKEQIENEIKEVV